MKKIIYCILFIVFCFLLIPPKTYAHFAATDGAITVVLHVDPNDDPTPGQPANLYFLLNFNDTTKKFHLNECNCVVTVTELQNNHSYQERLVQKNNPHLTIWGANMPFVFPQRDVYKVELTGKPLSSNAFKPFSLSWFFRVDTASSGIVKQATKRGLSDIQVLLMALGAVIIGLVIFGVFIKKEMQPAKSIDRHKKQ